MKITSPAKGQQVAIGKNLTLSGTSSYNATSISGVFVIVDDVRPYQDHTDWRKCPLDSRGQEEMIIQNGSTYLLQHTQVRLEKELIE